MIEGRKAMTFRFPGEIISLLAKLQAKMQISATAILVTALRELAKKEGVQ